jgi:hypothetical protein
MGPIIASEVDMRIELSSYYLNGALLFIRAFPQGGARAKPGDMELP